jgi:hypothetical protein
MNPRWLDLSDDWEQQPKFYDRPWQVEEMVRDGKPGLATSFAALQLRFAQNDIG